MTNRPSVTSDIRPGRRPAFTLIEVVVASVILVILAAVTIPQVMESLERKRVDDTYDILAELHYGIVNTAQTGFMNIVRSGASATNTGMVPGKLSQLSERIISNQAATYPNSCGATFNLTASTTWTLGGPFVSRVISTQGLKTPIGTIQNDLVRSPASPGIPAWILMRMLSVDSTEAVALDLRVDGAINNTVGTVRYGVPGLLTTVDYLIPVPNRC